MEVKLINGINLFSNDYEFVFDKILELYNKNGYLVINYLYFSNFVLSRNNPKYLEALQKSDFVFPDGVGLLTYVRLIYGARLNNLNGTDFNLYLIDSFDKLGFKIALYGAKKDSIAITYKKLVDKYKNIYYFQDGYSDLNIDNLNDKTVLFIGLGTPKQEIWLFDNLDKIISKNIIAITVGGFFDYVSGYQHRAPRIIRKLNLEWIFRLITDPKRNFKKTLRNFMFLPYLIIDFLELNFITKK